MTTWGLVVRIAVGVLGVAMILAAFVLLPAVGFPVLWLGAMGAALLVAAVFEVGRYRAASAGTDRTRFQRTDEVFVDPTTGVRTRVWFDARSGERRYEPEGE